MSAPADPAAGDLNQVIASAVQARIETQVAAAFSGSDLMAQYVAAALHQKIEVKDRDRYNTRTTTFLRETIDKAIQEATAAAVRRVIAEESAQIEAEVTKELRKNVKVLAAQLVGQVSESTKAPYGVTVTLNYPRT
jgi:hypothetical protein